MQNAADVEVMKVPYFLQGENGYNVMQHNNNCMQEWTNATSSNVVDFKPSFRNQEHCFKMNSAVLVWESWRENLKGKCILT